MLSNEPIDIEIALSSTYWSDPPKARIKLDNNLIFDNIITEPQTIKHSCLIEDGNHKITIELYDKNNYQTVLDNGRIIKDQLLNIDKISFDEIDIGVLLWKKSKYYPNKKDDLFEYPVLDCINLGWNGVWEIEFTTPIYIWLLENI